MYERQSRDAFRQSARADVLTTLNLLRSELQGAVAANSQLIQGLVALLEYQPDIDQARFALLGAKLIGGQTGKPSVAAE